MNGKHYLGDHYAAGEIGHLDIFEHTYQCGCGLYGCSETMVSGVALKRIQQTHFPEVALSDIFIAKVDHPEIVLFIDNMAKVISIVVTLLDVDQLVLGGGVIAMENFPIALLKQALLKRLRSQTMRDALKIYISTNDPKVGVIGGALFVQQTNPV